MAGLTNTGESAALTALQAVITHLGLLVAITDEEQDTVGVTEASYTSYARQVITWEGTGSARNNNGALTFPQVDVGEGPVTVAAISGHTALSAGAIHAIDDIVDEVLNDGGQVIVDDGDLIMTME